MSSDKQRWILATLVGAVVGAVLAMILAACGATPEIPTEAKEHIIQLADGRQVSCLVLPYNKGIDCDWDHAK